MVVNTTTGEIGRSYSSAEELDGTTYVKCGNRRAQACPTCSAEYKGDAWHLLLCGLAGGKGIPRSVSGHPCTFATFTAPPSARCTVFATRDRAGPAATSQSVPTAARCGVPSGTIRATSASGPRCAWTVMTTSRTWCGSGTPPSCGAGSPSPCNATSLGCGPCDDGAQADHRGRVHLPEPAGRVDGRDAGCGAVAGRLLTPPAATHPARGWATGAATLAVAGGAVSEAQMRALCGDGAHPDRDVGASPGDVTLETPS